MTCVSCTRAQPFVCGSVASVKVPAGDCVSQGLVREQCPCEYYGHRGFLIGVRPVTNVGGTGEGRLWRGVGGSEKEVRASLPDILAKMGKSELAGKSAA